ncbi:MAG TPA: hypothetical protein VE684_05520, partial [Crenalkalicoccus sp.]|nr:hypothetical protein [Crenalkalicoccus sp.]
MMLTFVLALATSGPALAQSPPASGTPQRIGPIWDWFNHEPNPAEIEAQRHARGLVDNARAEAASAAEVDRLYRELTGEDPSSNLGVGERA